MAAPRRRRAIWISCFRLCWRRWVTFAHRYDTLQCLLQNCWVRVTAGVVDRLLSKRGGDRRRLELGGLEFLSLRSKVACASFLRAAAALEDATHTSGAAVRPGTATVVKISAGLDCVSRVAVGSVVR